MRFVPLASSSHGNAYIVDDGSTRLLLECGLGPRKLRAACGFSVSEVAGVLVSHEHGDHAKSAVDLLKSGVAVYMSEGTAAGLGLGDGLLAMAKNLEHNVPVIIGSYDVVPFRVFHDAEEPLGFLIRSRTDGDVLVFATDTVNLRYRFPGVNLLAIEANYDNEILKRSTKMPPKTVNRIRNTHMEIDTLCDILKHMDLSRCRQIFLLHLSDGNSHEGHFINKVKRAVPPWVRVQVAQK